MIKHFIIFFIVITGLFISAEFVNSWEIANDYPFGKLCEVFNSCSNN